MTIFWKVVGTPNTITVDAVNLVPTILSSKPGTVINVVEGPPITCNISGVNITGVGISVILSPFQYIRSIMINCSGIHWMGGIWSGDVISGNRNVSRSNDGASLQEGTNRITFTGCLFDENNVGITTLEPASDIIIQDSTFSSYRNDAIQSSNTSRMIVQRCRVTDGNIGRSVCYFNDGTHPLIRSGQNSCEGIGGRWIDITHSDGWQFRRSGTQQEPGPPCRDLIARDNIFDADNLPGLVSFDSSGDNRVERMEVYNNHFSNSGLNTISIRGTDVIVRDNIVDPVTEEGRLPPRITVRRNFASDRIVGGRNQSPSSISDPDITLTSPTLTGDTSTVFPVTTPNIYFPKWVDFTRSRPDRPVTTVPIYVTLGNILYFGTPIQAGGTTYPVNPPTVGQWLSARPGKWKGFSGISYEYRWLRNNIILSGETNPVYRLTPDDVGQSIQLEIRGTNSVGQGLWYRIDELTGITT